MSIKHELFIKPNIYLPTSSDNLNIFQLKMDSSLKSINIWEEAVKEKNKEQVMNSLERILIVVGNSSVGNLPLN